MKSFLYFFFGGVVWAQMAVPGGLTPDTVVASYQDGRKVTAGELRNFLASLPPDKQHPALRDRKKLVEQYALMHRLSELAEQAKLDQIPDVHDALAFNRMSILTNAQLRDILDKIKVTPQDAEDSYKTNIRDFSQVKVKAIYVKFASPPSAGSTLPNEADAEAKVLKLREEIMKGAEFGKLAKANSDDPISAAKDGDFGTIRRTDNLPEAIRAVIFDLRPGQVSFPVRQPNGFYLFRVEEITSQPFDEVKDEIMKQVKEARFRVQMDEISSSLHLKIENQGFFEEGSSGAVSGK